MKKIIAGLFAAILVAAGLVAFSGSATNAAPYPGPKVITNSSGNCPSETKKGRKIVCVAKVKSKGSNADPKGEVTMTFTRRDGGYSLTKTKNYDGGAVEFSTSQLEKRGKYDVDMHFEGTKKFKNSNDSTSFVVTKN